MLAILATLNSIAVRQFCLYYLLFVVILNYVLLFAIPHWI